MSVEMREVGGDSYAKITTEGEFVKWVRDAGYASRVDFCDHIGIKDFAEIKGKWFTIINDRCIMGLPEREVFNKEMVDSTARRGTPKRQDAAWIKKHGFTNGSWRLEEQARLRAELKKRFQEIKDLEQKLMQLDK